MARQHIELNAEVVKTRGGLNDLRHHQVIKVEVGEYSLCLDFDNDKALVCLDYWELFDQGGVMIDRYVSPKNRQSCSVDKLTGQYIMEYHSDDGSVVDFLFSNGMHLWARYLNTDQAGLEDYKPFGDNWVGGPRTG